MSDEATVIETPQSDPLRSAADAMALALQAAKDGAADAQHRVNEALPAISGFVSRLTYTTCYAVSYGVVFPSLLIARAVPRENAVVHGIVDGARAAREAVGGQRVGGESADLSEHPHIIIPGSETTG